MTTWSRRTSAAAASSAATRSTQRGVARITGLDPLVTRLLTVPSAPIVANSVDAASARSTGNVWGEGNILLGGAGSDTIEGRGADDIIDGDRYLNVRLSVRTDAPATEIGSTDLMTARPSPAPSGPARPAMTLQQAVFAGLVDPGNIVAVREILTSTTPDTDVAVFSDALINYTIVAATVAGEKVLTVTHRQRRRRRCRHPAQRGDPPVPGW